MAITKTKLKELKKRAFDEGLEDTLIDEMIGDHAIAFVDDEVPEELTDEERDAIVEAYYQGVKKGI